MSESTMVWGDVNRARKFALGASAAAEQLFEKACREPGRENAFAYTEAAHQAIAARLQYIATREAFEAGK